MASPQVSRPAPTTLKEVVASRTRRDQDNSDLPWTQRTFLDALGFAGDLGAGGTALKLYNDVVGRGRREPITERDFTPADLERFRNLIGIEQKRSGSNTGLVSPDTYGILEMAGDRPDYNMIGGFKYDVSPDGSAVIRDTYDFNMDRASTRGVEGEGGMFQAITSPVGMAASIGRKRVPDTSGGVPVEIRIRRPNG